LTEQANILG